MGVIRTSWRVRITDYVVGRLNYRALVRCQLSIVGRGEVHRPLEKQFYLARKLSRFFSTFLPNIKNYFRKRRNLIWIIP